MAVFDVDSVQRALPEHGRHGESDGSRGGGASGQGQPASAAAAQDHRRSLQGQLAGHHAHRQQAKVRRH